ncbi:alpha/beta hydrolase [Luteimicrobium xylanilyticum]|uniref:alpha/beta fold hydrolase n=1 Tax=Luteimicrobium xylanilyticum TaxID=1133546 RepID=UPI001D159DD5|nr:alpha/beta hydrolase [Luteimicrobium xylanilyticum]
MRPLLDPSTTLRPGDDAAPQPAVRPSVVFVHGMRTSGAIWDEQLVAMHDAGYRAAAIDLPGHGVRRAEKFTLEGAYEAIDEAAHELAADDPRTPLALVGLSLGGYTSLAYASDRRDRPGAPLAGVVAASCSTDTRGLPLRTFTGALRGSLAAGRTMRELLGRTRTSVRRRLPAAPAVFTPGWDLVADALAHLAERSSVQNLRGGGVPVWLVNGSRDQLRMHERRHLRAVPGTRLVVVPGAGHDVSLEAPAAFNEAVLDALAAFGRARA